MSSTGSVSYASGTSAVPLLGETVGANLGRAVRRWQDRAALVDVPSRRRWTYAEFGRDIQVLGRGCSLPMAVPLVVLAPVTGRLTARFGPRLPVTAGAVVAACGALLLPAVRPTGHLLALEAALLLIGSGAGLVTVAVVAAAVRAVPAHRSGFASGMNNTARQTGTALGVAIFGAVAGPPAEAARFVARLHLLGLLGAALWLAACAVAATTVPGGRQG